MARLRDTNPGPVALPGGKQGQVSHDAAGRTATWSPTSTRAWAIYVVKGNSRHGANRPFRTP
jgi:hypothetical protein